MRNVCNSKHGIRVRYSHNMAGERMAWFDLYGCSYTGFNKREAAKFAKFLQDRVVPSLKKFAKENKS